ncbi:hypothetical protein QNI16_23050 [Cytophagaceae bacterium YF14B1]|uniref:Uncharacterized protein n=1 Tax=Xanthocytophaga flava TaxID=3048013 RepID=A0AAE3QR66_9BACT|nr:hypothetical protein [Xanthocytophaga flavus]MDJ1483396.1 hypothetical protein [Xanthocytophaga flavus]
MYKHFLLVLFLFFLSSSLNAQVQSSLVAVLQTKSFGKLKKYMDSVNRNEGSATIYRDYIRNLTTGYKEVIFCVDARIYKKENPSSYEFDWFRVTCITTSKILCYYELSKRKDTLVGGQKEHYYETITRYRNDSTYQLFRNEFQTLFQTKIDEHELFDEESVYEEGCGPVGWPSEWEEKIRHFVKNKETDSLMVWLHSINTEKQLYALKGLSQLKKKDRLHLTAHEKKIIRFIKYKKGTVRYCKGCVFGPPPSVRRIARKFHFGILALL